MTDLKEKDAAAESADLDARAAEKKAGETHQVAAKEHEARGTEQTDKSKL
jgi:hypothetical protein